MGLLHLYIQLTCTVVLLYNGVSAKKSDCFISCSYGVLGCRDRVVRTYETDRKNKGSTAAARSVFEPDTEPPACFCAGSAADLWPPRTVSQQCNTNRLCKDQA